MGNVFLFPQGYMHWVFTGRDWRNQRQKAKEFFGCDER